MAQIRSIHFNTETEAAAEAIPNLLRTSDFVSPLLRRSINERAAATGLEASDIQSRDRNARQWTMETAARYHLQTLLENQDSASMAAITSPERPELVPNMQVEREQAMPLVGTHSVAFLQTSGSLPIFGTRIVVEIDPATRQLVTVDGTVTDLPDIPPIPNVGIGEAAEKLARFLSCEVSDLVLTQAPALSYYARPNQSASEGVTEATWHLVYVFRNVPVEPPPPSTQSHHDELHMCGAASHFGPIPYDYLVDANEAVVLYYYASANLIDVPIACDGVDVDGVARSFYGTRLKDNLFQMTDPLRAIDTHDAAFADVAFAAPAVTPVRHSATSFPDTSSAAVTAHFYISQVFDFFASVLKRNGIDGKGMRLVSYVNCYNSRGNEASPRWRNAMWSRGSMWFGSVTDSAGNLLSTARYLDIMAHELAHGVTNTTSGLIYRDESGALNESFSDIFAIIIKNWFPDEPNSLAGWDWKLGADWRGAGTYLRDFENPSMNLPIFPLGSGQPAHMDDFYSGAEDFGGVHVNSGIHNRAFYNVMNTKDGGNYVFDARELAVLYYVALTRLGSQATFKDCRNTLINVTIQQYSGQPTLRALKVKSIEDGYSAVGIN